MAPSLVVLSPEAEEEARAAFEWYYEQNQAVAARFEAELTAAVESLEEMPERGTQMEQGIRRISLPRFPYGLLYSQEEGRVLLVAVMHTRRSPG